MAEFFCWATNLKEVGNVYLKKRDFTSASFIYESILDVVVYEMDMKESYNEHILDLLVSCYSNLSTCELKLGHFDYVISLCSVILGMDQSHTKSLY